MRRRLLVLGVLVGAIALVRALADHPRRAGPSVAGLPAVDGFDFPVAPPDGAGYYDAQPFGVNAHLGSDWNDVRGGDSDRGAPVHAIAAGRVTEAEDVGGGWGNVVRIAHRVEGGVVESLAAHLERIDVRPGQVVARGEIIGTIGDAHGQYRAHLHLELRAEPGLALGGGYGEAIGHLDPSAFIRGHRPPR